MSGDKTMLEGMCVQEMHLLCRISIDRSCLNNSMSGLRHHHGGRLGRGSRLTFPTAPSPTTTPGDEKQEQEVDK